VKFVNGKILLFKGGQNEELETFLRDLKRICIFEIIGAHT
jgi:hypothetical protein